MYVEIYIERLSHRPILEDYNTLKVNKEFLFELILKVTKTCSLTPLAGTAMRGSRVSLGTRTGWLSPLEDDL